MINFLIELFKNLINKNNNKIKGNVSVYSILNNRIKELTFINSPNYGKDISPEILVLHYTAGGTLEGAVNTFKNMDNRVSAHFIIDRDGTVVQMVDLNKAAYHAGESIYKGRRGVNSFSIGIEIVNWGICGKSTETPKTWTNKILGENECEIAKNYWWYKYTDEQIKQLNTLCNFLIKEFNIKDIVGHEDISPGRKVDPGPLLYKFIKNLKIENNL